MNHLLIDSTKLSDLFEEKLERFIQTKEAWVLAREEGGNVIELFEKMKRQKQDLQMLKKKFVPTFDSILITSKPIENELTGPMLQHESFAIFQNEVIILDRLVEHLYVSNDSTLVSCNSCGNLLRAHTETDVCFTCRTE